MPTFSNIDGEESATVTFTVAAVSLTRNSSGELQEILCLGDPEVASSLGLARVVNTAPASTMAGLVVRIAGGPSSVADFSVRAVLPSTAADNPVAFPSTQSVQAKNSTIGDLLASVQQNSTVWQVQIPSSQSVQVKNSTIGDLLASVQQNSTVWVTQPRLFTSSGGGVEGSTVTLSTGELGLNVRTVMPTGRQSTSILVNIGTAGGSSVLISSVAGLKHKVYAFSVMSTVTGVSSVAFVSSAAIERWGLILGSQSSGITGANLAVTPPGFLFETVAANALNFLASSTGLYRVSLAWFTEA